MLTNNVSNDIVVKYGAVIFTVTLLLKLANTSYTEISLTCEMYTSKCLC